MPAHGEQGFFIPQIPGLVVGDFGRPPLRPRSRQAEGLAVLMTVPETAVHEDDGPVFRQDEVGLARERPVERAVDGEAIAHAVKNRAQGQFRLGVPATDARHDFGAFLRGEDVHVSE